MICHLLAYFGNLLFVSVMLQNAVILSFFWHLSETFALQMSHKRGLLLELGVLFPSIFLFSVF